MLTHLYIRNFAIVDELELDLGAGMTVLTGETGAGKSILLDALGLALGDRADSAVVRHGNERAEIAATFAIDALDEVSSWLEAHELEAEDGCLIRRTVGADGRSRGYINGRPAPVQLLKELGEQLVDIHGQHAHQYLLKREAQRLTLDAFGALGEHALRVSAAYNEWRRLSDELEDLTRASSDREARLDLLRYQVEELEGLELSAAELARLAEEHERLANMTRLQEGTHGAAALLSAEDSPAAVTLLQRAAAELQELAGYDPALTPIAELADGAGIQAGEAAAELRRYLDRLEFDPVRLAEVEQRLDAVQALARKHRCQAEELPALLEGLRTERDELEASETRFGDLSARIEQALERYRQEADSLSREREKAAKRLAKQVTANMQELGMKGGRFAVDLERDEAPGPHGHDRIQFQVSANPGQPLRPLQKVASGGELSRISLAIQVITAGREGIPTLIFDEVDVGVGGGVAEIVGRQLRALGGESQVLCVTHQPQVAAQGHSHLQIAKRTQGKTTRTGVQPLEGEARVEEVARMLGGVAITEQTLSHAREMITLAQSEPAAKRSTKA